MLTTKVDHSFWLMSRPPGILRASAELFAGLPTQESRQLLKQGRPEGVIDEEDL